MDDELREFKIGDRIITNPEFDKEFRFNVWWNQNKDRPMTIKGFGKKTNSLFVNENIFGWQTDWVLKIEEFFSEEEFEI